MTDERLKLVAPCGIDCGICELNICENDPRLMDALISKGIPKDKIPCAGCRAIKGDCPVIKSKCETYKCAAEKNVEFCFKCGEFPCVKLQPSADRANILPHNMKVFNLCSIKRDGLDDFVLKSSGIKQRYYTGKMAIGSGPQVK
jgi:hypothetical protein